MNKVYKWLIPEHLLVPIHSNRIVGDKVCGQNTIKTLSSDIIDYLEKNNIEYWLHIAATPYLVFKSKSIPVFLKIRWNKYD